MRTLDAIEKTTGKALTWDDGRSLAKAAGTNMGTVAKWLEADLGDLPLSAAYKLSKALGVSVDRLCEA